MTYRVIRRARRLWAKLLIVVVALLIPTADAVYGRMRLAEMCRAEGGLKVFRKAGNVEGFLKTGIPADEQWFKRIPYKFVESERKVAGRRSVERLSQQPDGSVALERDVVPKGQYSLAFIPGDLSDMYMRTEHVVQSIDGKEPLGRIRDFNYAGGWVERGIAALYAARGEGGTCGLSRDTFALQLELLAATLNPG